MIDLTVARREAASGVGRLHSLSVLLDKLYLKLRIYA